MVFSPWDSKQFLYWGVGKFYHFSRSNGRPAFHEIFIPIFVPFEPLILPHLFSRITHCLYNLLSFHAFQTCAVFQSHWSYPILGVGSLTALVLFRVLFACPALLVLCSCHLPALLIPSKLSFSLSSFPESPLFPLSYPPSISHHCISTCVVRFGVRGTVWYVWQRKVCHLPLYSLHGVLVTEWLPSKCLIKLIWKLPLQKD